MPDAAPATDLDIPALESALSRRIVGRRIHYYDLIGSTMDEARRLAAEGMPEGTVVIAEEQTAGRGRFNRAWVSPRGENLSFSVILTPTAKQLPYMNMAATLAVARTVADTADLKPTIKWPNDVRVGGAEDIGHPHRDCHRGRGLRLRHHRHRRQRQLRSLTLRRDRRHLDQPLP